MTVKLDIISDPICPWCYIGKTLLDRALAERPGHPFVVEWHPFQLNPDMPREGMDRRAYLESKFGKGRADEVYNQIAERARAEGIEADFPQITRTPNTVDAHRLIHWAGLEQVQNKVVDALFAANFREGRDIGDREVLCDIADSCGMDASVVGRLLESDADEQAIRDRDAHSRKMGVNSVPTFIVAQQHAVPGAQPVELWLQVIDEIIAQVAAAEDQPTG
ncbi:Predicted dithiol-disulfide isomerase, DsbA family [Pseudooceanicola antarcticus]|uniref:DsbA family oxidoreductase n=1 Tax=Pseudooceanicola antarcticus TaxID=1247613 RepID=A0A285IXJ9_9RHOB|nr:DsbA family oxidoreductase [Pseudooceanicola antarcticus]PJE25903.1 DsbA family oxidoreductase [Pseudooceanicola antarcticus]SNY52417.1 Predicted dithiol-disulfide isomerase, DsbA family [Pseudooceanicola antarcticus]